MATAEAGALSDKNGNQEPDGDEGSMTLWEHLEELRGRIIRGLVAFLVGAIVSWLYKEQILHVLTIPFDNAWRDVNPADKPTLHFGAPAALFFSYVHLSALAGFVVALPFVLYQLWAFIAPGLYSREKRFALPFVFSSCLLFGLGGYFGWAVAFPAAFRFLLGFADKLPGGGPKVVPTIMVGDYLDFCTRMLLAFGATAELPILAAFLTVAGVITHRHLIKFFRYFIVVAFVIAAIVTPPDPLSQLLLAIPLIGLYGIGIGVAWMITKARERRAAGEAKAEAKAEKAAAKVEAKADKAE